MGEDHTCLSSLTKQMGVVRRQDGAGQEVRYTSCYWLLKEEDGGRTGGPKQQRKLTLFSSDEEDSDEELPGQAGGNSKTSVEVVKKELQQMLRTPSHQVYRGAYPTWGRCSGCPGQEGGGVWRLAEQH